MPLSRDPLGGGSNADGSRTTEYCSRCFEKGLFTQPNITAAEMQTLVEGKLRSMHFPGFLARRFAGEVPTLRRWRGKTSSSTTREPSTSELQPRA
jgi:hypothetical protein